MSNFSFIQKIRNKIRISSSSKIELGNNLKIVGSHITIKGANNSLIIDENSIIRNSSLEIMGENCKIHIKSGCMIGDNSYLVVKESNVNLIIGKECGLSRNVKIMTSDGHPIYQDGKRINFAKDIVLEDNVWVADNVTILKGVHIGENSVLGIESLVTKSVPKNSIAAGNPAKTVKKNIMWKP